MKKQVNGFWGAFLQNQPPARCAGAKPILSEATMDMEKVNQVFLHLSPRYIRPNNVLAETHSDSATYLEDKRVAQLFLLLRQLQRSAGGLCGLPTPELTDIVSSAVHLCGFVNPRESRDVTAAVLDALEMKEPMSESS
ncbi:MAG: hypothetical protein WAN65_17440 [Candidatus Sulfotelmatobacter sp.]